MQTRSNLKTTEAEEIQASTLSIEQRRFLEEHGHCAMCDGPLEARHELNLAELRIREEAHCPACGLRVRSRQYPVH